MVNKDFYIVDGTQLGIRSTAMVGGRNDRAATLLFAPTLAVAHGGNAIRLHLGESESLRARGGVDGLLTWGETGLDRLRTGFVVHGDA